jgi:all-trans-retinol dehydrogenase (NAD+)
LALTLLVENPHRSKTCFNFTNKIMALSTVQKTVICFLFPFEIIYIVLYSVYIVCRNIVKCFIPGKPKSLEDEIILVTGGANGIGREICLRLAEEERNLTIITWDINEEKNLATLKLLKDLDVRKAFAFTVDVSDRDQVSSVAEKIRREIGDVTILFNNAGYGGDINYAWKQQPALIEKTFDVNILSHYWTMREFLPKMIDAGRGHIIETCSVLGFVYASGGSAYAASKFAMRGCFHSVKEELRRLPTKPNIKISLVYPSMISTDMIAGIDVRPKRHFFLGVMTSPAVAARQIVDGVRLNKEHIYIPGSVRIMHFLMGILPDEAYAKMSDFMGSPGMDS